MSLKKELAKELQILEEEIKELEIKRSRSQACIIEALVSKVDPNPTELQFFRQYTAEINIKRENHSRLTQRLKNLV